MTPSLLKRFDAWFKEKMAANNDTLLRSHKGELRELFRAALLEMKGKMQNARVDITPIEESRAAGMGIGEAYEVNTYARGYNAAVTDMCAIITKALEE